MSMESHRFLPTGVWYCLLFPVVPIVGARGSDVSVVCNTAPVLPSIGLPGVALDSASVNIPAHVFWYICDFTGNIGMYRYCIYMYMYIYF